MSYALLQIMKLSYENTKEINTLLLLPIHQCLFRILDESTVTWLCDLVIIAYSSVIEFIENSLNSSLSNDVHTNNVWRLVDFNNCGALLLYFTTLHAYQTILRLSTYSSYPPTWVAVYISVLSVTFLLSIWKRNVCTPAFWSAMNRHLFMFLYETESNLRLHGAYFLLCAAETPYIKSQCARLLRKELVA